MQSWKTIARRVLIDLGKFLRVELHTVELPDGRIISDWPWVVTPDYTNVVAVTEGGEFLCFRQGKYAISGTALALVGGYLERDEDPDTAARRELVEETGYAAEEWVHMGNYAVDGNRGCGVAHFYLARNAHRVTERNADDLEEQELLRLSRSEVEAALDGGEFKLLPWAANMALALRYLSKSGGKN